MKFHDISNSTRQRLTQSRLNPDDIVRAVSLAFAEDLDGGEDVTSVATIPVDHKSIGEFVARDSGVIAGVDVVSVVLEMVGLHDIEQQVSDSERVEANTRLLSVRGDTREILLAERTALNFICHLSGIATLTSKWVEAVAGSKTKIRDTRKTTPGYRKLEKYAVRMGGALNHRMSLSESALIKDNHIVAAGGVKEAFSKVRSTYPKIEIEIEVDNLGQLEEIIPFGPDLVLLDNMSVAECKSAVELVKGKFALEASGGLTL
ncbi:MAG: carboxylating nicotinate-nucleotide diphosphorylase, partial [Actinomycetota bacterium]